MVRGEVAPLHTTLKPRAPQHGVHAQPGSSVHDADRHRTNNNALTIDERSTSPSDDDPWTSRVRSADDATDNLDDIAPGLLARFLELSHTVRSLGSAAEVADALREMERLIVAHEIRSPSLCSGELCVVSVARAVLCRPLLRSEHVALALRLLHLLTLQDVPGSAHVLEANTVEEIVRVAGKDKLAEAAFRVLRNLAMEVKPSALVDLVETEGFIRACLARIDQPGLDAAGELAVDTLGGVLQRDAGLRRASLAVVQCPGLLEAVARAAVRASPREHGSPRAFRTAVSFAALVLRLDADSVARLHKIRGFVDACVANAPDLGQLPDHLPYVLALQDVLYDAFAPPFASGLPQHRDLLNLCRELVLQSKRPACREWAFSMFQHLAGTKELSLAAVNVPGVVQAALDAASSRKEEAAHAALLAGELLADLSLAQPDRLLGANQFLPTVVAILGSSAVRDPHLVESMLLVVSALCENCAAAREALACRHRGASACLAALGVVSASPDADDVHHLMHGWWVMCRLSM